MPTWVAPTARAVEWLPLVAVGAVLVATSTLASHTGRWPLDLVGVAAGAVAAATVAGLQDPAADLLAALPTSATRRRAHRLALLVPLALAVWMAYLWPGQSVTPTPGWPLAPLVALLATGLAVVVLAPPAAAMAAGVAAPLVWTAADRVGGRLDDTFRGVLSAWQHHPWLVITAAVAALAWKRKS